MKVTLADTAIMVEGWRAEYDSLGDYTLRGRKTPEELKQEKEVNRKVAEKYDTKPRKVNPMRFENKTVLIYDEKDRSRVYFLPGLWPSVKGFFDMNKIPYTVEDKRDMSIRPNPDYSVLQGVEFRENQDLALALIASADCGIIETATAWGKCHAPGTPILMYNGKKKPVEDVKAGDQLMGDDSTVRHVLTCTKGRGQMFKVIPKYGKAYKYNKDHILVLKKIDGTIVEISIEDYLKLSEKEQSALYLYRNEVVFAHRKEPEIDPYFIGAHMAAGAYDNRSIYHIPDKVVDYCCKYIKKLKGHYTRHSYAFIYNGDHRLLKKIKEHTKASINSPQHIDNEIKYGSIDVRKQFIAGLVDCSFNDTQNSRDKFEIQAVHYKKVAKEIAFIVNSIGMIAEVEPSGEQYKVSIRGNLYKIPTKDSISNAQEANERIPFTIEEASVDDYYGFTVDGNHRYLLGDCLVTHNSFLISVICKVYPTLNILVCTSSSTVVATLCEYLQKQLPREVGYIYGKGNTSHGKRVVVSTLKSLDKIPAEKVQLLLCDECHDVGDNNAGQSLMRFCFARRFGFSASPVRNDGSALVMTSIFGPTIMKMTYQESVEAGMVTPMKYLMLPCNRGAEICKNPNLPEVLMKRYAYWCNYARNKAIQQFVYDVKGVSEGQILIMVATLEHAIQLHRLLPWFKVAYYGSADIGELRKRFPEEKYPKLDLNAYKTTQKQLDIMRQAFSKGTLRYVISTTVFKQGVNFNQLQVLIRCDGATSEIMGIQIPGRLARLADDKDYAYLVDFQDTFCQWAVRRAEAREKLYKEQQWSKVTREEVLRDLGNRPTSDTDLSDGERSTEAEQSEEASE